MASALGIKRARSPRRAALCPAGAVAALRLPAARRAAPPAGARFFGARRYREHGLGIGSIALPRDGGHGLNAPVRPGLAGCRAGARHGLKHGARHGARHGLQSRGLTGPGPGQTDLTRPGPPHGPARRKSGVQRGEPLRAAPCEGRRQALHEACGAACRALPCTALRAGLPSSRAFPRPYEACGAFRGNGRQSLDCSRYAPPAAGPSTQISRIFGFRPSTRPRLQSLGGSGALHSPTAALPRTGSTPGALAPALTVSEPPPLVSATRACGLAPR